MPHSYRALQQWQHWLETQPFGGCLLEEEARELKNLTEMRYGKHALLLGVPKQHVLLSATPFSSQSLLSPLPKQHNAHNLIEGDFQHPPFQSGSVDLVMLPHTLELVANPRQLLTETCRIVKPEGMIVIYGFNPYSFLRLRQFSRHKALMPKHASLIRLNLIKNWLRLLNFEIEVEKTFLFKKPTGGHPSTVDRILRLLFPKLGGIYIICARAKTFPLTPIRMKWTQKLSTIGFPESLPGHFVKRTSK